MSVYGSATSANREGLFGQAIKKVGIVCPPGRLIIQMPVRDLETGFIPDAVLPEIEPQFVRVHQYGLQ